MKVTDIDIRGLHYAAGVARYEGHVSMELQHGANEAPPMHLQFLCHADQHEGAPSTLVTYDLIKDALRQARRMPGFRRGEVTIEVDISSAMAGVRASSA